MGQPVKEEPSAVEKFKYCLPLRVRYAETDMQGHVFFANYLIYFDEASTNYMRAIGCTYDDMVRAGADIYYIHSECDYRSRAFFEDTLNIQARAGQIGNSSITFEFAAVREQNDEVVATGKIVAVCIDPHTKKTVRVPAIFREAVARYEGS